MTSKIEDILKGFGVGGSAGIALIGYMCVISADSTVRLFGYVILSAIAILVLSWAGVPGWFGLYKYHRK